jgi:hypothetical protein
MQRTRIAIGFAVHYLRDIIGLDTFFGQMMTLRKVRGCHKSRTCRGCNGLLSYSYSFCMVIVGTISVCARTVTFFFFFYYYYLQKSNFKTFLNLIH